MDFTPIFWGQKSFYKFLKKVVAFDLPLCYNNFCPLERGATNRRNKRFAKKSLKKLLTKISKHDILNELWQSRATTSTLTNKQ